MKRYYSTLRPFGPGTFPQKDGRETITNFDGPAYCEEIGREAWGYIEYPEALTKEEAESYDLTEAGMKTFWCVTTSYDDRGRVISNITNTVQAAEKPKDTYVITRRRDIYNDWFESREAAEEHVKEARTA